MFLTSPRQDTVWISSKCLGRVVHAADDLSRASNAASQRQDRGTETTRQEPPEETAGAILMCPNDRQTYQRHSSHQGTSTSDFDTASEPVDGVSWPGVSQKLCPIRLRLLGDLPANM